MGTNNPMGYPSHVGILAMEVYFPNVFISQEKLEEFDGVGKGKYTIGLGQQNMGFCGDREDINSVCLTVVKSLFEKYNIDPCQIGRLEVGTESRSDKSKSVKTVLMQLLEESGNTNVDGVDCTNACYGGTAALFNACNWIESSAWDKRLALVVCGDIAVYAKGNARPTGGAGAVAMLVGPGAPLVFERGLRFHHMEHVYDFYKPYINSEYPEVDGQLSIKCYLKAVDECYKLYAKNASKLDGKPFSVLDGADFFVFHSPFNKLVQKSFARLMVNDFWNESYVNADLEKHRAIKREDSYFNRDLEKDFMAASKDLCKQKVDCGSLLGRNIGNMYTASLYGALVSILGQSTEDLTGKRIVLFSYGSGATAAMFSLRVRNSVESMKEKMQITARLASRIEVPPADFEKTLEVRASRYGMCDYTPSDSIEQLAPNTYYLTCVDAKGRRTYARK